MWQGRPWNWNTLNVWESARSMAVKFCFLPSKLILSTTTMLASFCSFLPFFFSILLPSLLPSFLPSYYFIYSLFFLIRKKIFLTPIPSSWSLLRSSCRTFSAALGMANLTRAHTDTHAPTHAHTLTHSMKLNICLQAIMRHAHICSPILALTIPNNKNSPSFPVFRHGHPPISIVPYQGL